MNDFKPTDEQVAVAAAVRRRDGASVMVEAAAGCAKTSTLVLAAKGVRTPALAVAFNKKIADEMKEKLPAGYFTCKTMNSLGMQAWARALSGVTLKLDDRKLGRLCSAVARDRRVKLSEDQWDALRRLTARAMQEGLVPASAGDFVGLLPDDPVGWAIVADQVDGVNGDLGLLQDLGREVLERAIAEARAGIISFDDQIYCSTLLGGRFSAWPMVFVDEDQDLSPLQHLMVQKCLGGPAGRLVAVGDRRQAIYAWRGASGDSAERLRRLRPEWTDLPLMTTFRCPKVVVERQQGHVPGYRAALSCKQGRFTRHQRSEGVEDWEGWSEKSFAGWGESSAAIAVLCRNNAPLLKLAFKLIRRGVGVDFLGRELGKGLLALSRRLAPDDGLPAANVYAEIARWEEREVGLAMANGREDKLDGIYDKSETLRATLDGSEARCAGDLRRSLELLFAKRGGQITLSSIHKAKGLEWDLVVLLDSWRLPSKWAKKAGGVALVQEHNLRYVAETRTKDSLVLADMEDFR